MSFTEQAREFVIEQADAFEAKARSVGILRSVDATQAADWLDDLAKELRAACQVEGEPTLKQVDAEARDAMEAALAWVENMARTTRREALSRRLRRALGKPEGWLL